MTEHAIIAGSLVDVRNVGTHKSVKLTIHVPEEHATRVVAAFGWPTGVNPVSVAIARLDERKVRPPEQPNNDQPTDTQPRPDSTVSASSSVPAGAKRKFEDMSPAQQAGMLCQDEAFIRFLNERYPGDLRWIAEDWDFQERPHDTAAEFVRLLCKVNSRADIKPNNPAWLTLVSEYRLWQRHPELSAV